jgi:hypothetical protein
MIIGISLLVVTQASSVARINIAGSSPKLAVTLRVSLPV